MYYRNLCQKPRRELGGVAFRVVACAASLAVLAAVIILLMGKFQAGKEGDHHRAVVLAEYGLQKAFEELAVSRDWSEGFRDEAMDDESGGSFGVVVTRGERDGAPYVKIVSTGTSGSITQAKECTLRLEVSEGGDSAWVNEGIR